MSPQDLYWTYMSLMHGPDYSYDGILTPAPASGVEGTIKVKGDVGGL